jgi:hypothetical protein
MNTTKTFVRCVRFGSGLPVRQDANGSVNPDQDLGRPKRSSKKEKKVEKLSESWRLLSGLGRAFICL